MNTLGGKYPEIQTLSVIVARHLVEMSSISIDALVFGGLAAGEMRKPRYCRVDDVTEPVGLPW